MSNSVDAYLSKWVENILVINGNKFSFELFPPKRVIYDDPSNFIIEQTSRQVGKSVDIAAIQIGMTTAIPFFKTLYVAPQSKHKSEFSHNKLNPLIKGSPFITLNYTSYRLVDNVDLKQFTNGSYIQLKHAYLTALPLRGPSSDYNFWDEYQDANPAIFNIGQETLTRSMYKKTMVAGTPKSSLTPLARVWESSTKYEVLYKCSSCGHWNLPSMQHIKPNGACCERCSTLLTPDKWEWVSTGIANSDISGYHYNKLGLSIFRDKATFWNRDIWNKLNGPDGERLTLKEFKNEVLGESDDSSIRPISVQDIKNCCDSNSGILTLEGFEKNYYNDLVDLKIPMYCAIDWGTTNTSTSNTILILGYPKPGNTDKIKVVLFKKFVGEESSYAYILNYIYRLYKTVPYIKFFAADNGMGAAPNSLIRNKIGADKLFGFQFVANQKNKTQWHVVEGSSQEELNAYFTVSKVTAYDQFFYEIKEQLWEFPNWMDFEMYGKEILNVEQEFNEDKNKYIYTHATENPDDVPSTLIYLRLLIELSTGI